jgi:hypothetical protein
MNNQGPVTTPPCTGPSPSHPPERPHKIRGSWYDHTQITKDNKSHSNNYQQPITMERLLPSAPRKGSYGPFQYREKAMNASDASTKKFKMPKYNFAVKPKPKTLLQKLETSKAGGNDEMCSQSSALIQAASRRPAPPPSILQKLSVDVRIMIYDACFKGIEQNPNQEDYWARKEAPSLVIALRGHPNLYNEVIDRYYRCVNFTLSDYNLREFQDHFPMRFARVIRHLTVDTQYVTLFLLKTLTC